MFATSAIIDDCILASMLAEYPKCGSWVKVRGENEIAYEKAPIIFDEFYGWTTGRCEGSWKHPGFQYKWQPHSTRYYMYSRKDICTIIRGRHILIVGDSLSAQSFFSFLATMSSFSPFGSSGPLLGNAPGITTIYCPTGSPNFNITFMRNDLISINTVYMSAPKLKLRPWLEVANSLPSNSIFLFNRGLHYREDKEFLYGLNETFHFLSELRKTRNHIVIYRSTSPVHPDWETMFNNPPLKVMPTDAPIYTVEQSETWGWDKIANQTELARGMIAQYYPWIIYMDVMYSTSLRHDGHVDGVHYCLPGPVDHWIAKIVATIYIIDKKACVQ